jgi:RecJ-like exonuclease
LGDGFCNNQGMSEEAAKTKTCRACNGTGKINEQKNAAKRRSDLMNPVAFSGAGRKPCPKCGGTGKV